MRDASEGLPDGEMESESTQDGLVACAVQPGVGERNDVVFAVTWHFRHHAQLFGELGVDADVDANGPDWRDIPYSKARSDRSRPLRDVFQVRQRLQRSLADDGTIDEHGPVELA